MPVWRELERKMGGRQARQAAVDAFNQSNRWRKRGLYSIPVKYARGNREREMVILQVSAIDGTVTVATSGVEMGQGLNTKVAQAVAMSLSKALLPATSPSPSPSSSSTTDAVSSTIAIAPPAVPVTMVHNTGVKSTADFPRASGTSGSGTVSVNQSISQSMIQSIPRPQPIAVVVSQQLKPHKDWAS